jgi:hypothetical protein
VTEILARAGGPRNTPEAEDEDPFLIIANLLERVMARLEALEKRREARAGRDGLDGRSILDVRIDGANGHLMVQFSDGELRDVGRVVADRAPPPTQLDFVRDGVTGRITAARLR